MANEPERISLRFASATGGALLWIAIRADRGHPVTRAQFLEEFTGQPWAADYGRGLLDHLHRGGLVDEQPDGRLSITKQALEWIDAADFWRRIADTVTGQLSSTTPD